MTDDLDLFSGWLRVRNKPKLGWQVKTRNERDIPWYRRSSKPCGELWVNVAQGPCSVSGAVLRGTFRHWPNEPPLSWNEN
jgi:hypothetical protein